METAISARSSRSFTTSSSAARSARVARPFRRRGRGRGEVGGGAAARRHGEHQANACAARRVVCIARHAFPQRGRERIRRRPIERRSVVDHDQHRIVSGTGDRGCERRSLGNASDRQIEAPIQIVRQRFVHFRRLHDDGARLGAPRDQVASDRSVVAATRVHGVRSLRSDRDGGTAACEAERTRSPRKILAR